VTGQELSKWADRAMYVSEPATSKAPVVTLLSATADPLGEIASLCAMYTGKVVRSLRDVTDEERRTAMADMQLSKLSGPLEAVTFHFLFENVSRAFTHQAVRTRQQFVAQESLRFAVVEDWDVRAPLPPSIEPGSPEAYAWQEVMATISDGYTQLVDAGVPAEDARGLLPHALTTRMHVVLNLRTLIHLAGLRLCTQAQFEWRTVMAGIVNALRQYGNRDVEILDRYGDLDTACGDPWSWQYAEIADLLKPICYQEGKCGFMASMDRGCKIRERVDANAKVGRPSSEWHEDKDLGPANEVFIGMPLFPWVRNGRDVDGKPDRRADRNIIPAIRPEEWAADPTAARYA
jgi:flavin-dependent thymidylate synthase